MMNSQNNHIAIPLIPVLMACLGAMLLGFSPIFVRMSDLGPLSTGFYRMFFSLPLLWVWMSWEKTRNENKQNLALHVKDYLIMILAGLFFALDLGLWNWSIGYTAIVNATLFNNTAAFFVPLLMWLLFAEKQSKIFILAVLFGFLGCILLAGESFTISLQNLLGDIVSLSSGLMVALYVITIKKIRDKLSTGLIMFWTGVTSAIGMGILTFLFNESFWPLTMSDFLSILGQALLVHVAGQGLLAYAMGRIPASYGALIMLLAPVTAAALGWLIYSEYLSFMKMIGIAIIMTSIVAVRGQNLNVFAAVKRVFALISLKRVKEERI
jgi:drug/metabolite transporter (DMT)-like permease